MKEYVVRAVSQFLVKIVRPSMSGPYILAESNFFINLFSCHIYVNSMLYYSYDKTSVDPEDREGTQNLNLVPYSILDKKLRIILIEYALNSCIAQ